MSFIMDLLLMSIIKWIADRLKNSNVNIKQGNTAATLLASLTD